MDLNKADRLAGAELIRHIKAACEGLTFMSETDSPVEPFFAGAAPSVSLSSLAEGLDHPLERPIEEREPGSFFDRLTRGRNWHTPRQKRNVKGFAKLERLLMDELTDLRVFRTGTVRITIYVVGLDAENNLSGIRTEAVET